MIDAEVYFASVLRSTVDALVDDASPSDELVKPHIAPDIDTQTMEQLPAITWNVVGDGSVANGPGLYGFILSVSVFGEGMDQAKKYARLLDEAITSWDEDPNDHVLDVDGDRINIAGTERSDMISRISGPIVELRNLTQYSGSYAVALRGI